MNKMATLKREIMGRPLYNGAHCRVGYQWRRNRGGQGGPGPPWQKRGGARPPLKPSTARGGQYCFGPPYI